MKKGNISLMSNSGRAFPGIKNIDLYPVFKFSSIFLPFQTLPYLEQVTPLLHFPWIVPRTMREP